MFLLTLISLLMACSVEDDTVEEPAATNRGIEKVDVPQEEEPGQANIDESEEEEIKVVNSNFVGIDQIVHKSGAIVTFDAETGALLGVILPEYSDQDATIATLEVVRDILGEDNEQFLTIQAALAE